MPTLRTQLVLDDMKHLKDEFVMLVYTAATIVCTSLTGCWSLDVARWDNLSVSIAEGDTVTLTCRSPTPERRTRGSLGLVQGEDRGVGMVPLWDSGLQGEAVNRRYRITYRVSGPKSVLRLTIRDAKEEDSGSYGCLLNSDERTASYMTLNVLEDAESRRKMDSKYMLTATVKTTTHLGIKNSGTTCNTSAADGSQSLADMLGDFSEVLDKLKEQMRDFNNANNGRTKGDRPPKDVKDVNYARGGHNDILLGLIPLPIIIIVFLVALPRCTRNRRVWRGIPGAYDLSADMTRESVRNRQHGRAHRGCGLTHSPSCPNFIQASSQAQSPAAPGNQTPTSGPLCVQPPPYSELPDHPVYVAAKYSQELWRLRLSTGGVRGDSPPPYSSDYFNLEEGQEDVAVSLISGQRPDFGVPVSRPPSYTSLDMNAVCPEIHSPPRTDEFS